jgi:hypothetical protein
LITVVEEFDGLLEADGEEEADRDGANVDEEVGPGVSGFVRSVDVDHEVVPSRLFGRVTARGLSGR